jgi:hypothetical protein
MNRYHNGKIYKLVNTVDTRIYVGSTAMPLSKRLSAHKQSARYNPAQRVYEALNTVGWENVRIVQIEALRCDNKQELIAREQFYIDLLRPSLNKIASSGHICEHNIKRCLCKECGGKSICSHKKYLAQCKECGGVQICEHDKQRSVCKECGGSQICQHNLTRAQCRDCGGSAICPHEKNRSQCKDCGGSKICPHNLIRSHCKICSPVDCDFCGVMSTKGSYNKHCQSARHKRNESAEFLRVFGFPMDD